MRDYLVLIYKEKNYCRRNNDVSFRQFEVAHMQSSDFKEMQGRRKMANNDRIYAAYMGEMGETFKLQTRNRINWILQQVRGRKKILDIGCSQGIISILCAQQGSKVTGVEIQKENCDFAKHLLDTEYDMFNDSVRFINQDFMEYEENEKYDAVILTEVLEHLPNAEEFLTYAAQFLNEDGIVIITVPFSYSDHPDHVYTFYLTSLMKLVERVFKVKNIYYGGRWLACVAGQERETLELDKELFMQEEMAFLDIHKDMDIRLKSLASNLADANQRYKESCEAYNRIKEWHNDEQQKNAELIKKFDRMKEWHENDIKKIEALNENITALKGWHENDIKKIEALNENITTYKQWHGNNLKKIQSMQDRLDKDKVELDKLGKLKNTAEEKLTDIILAEEEQVLTLKKAKELIQKQQIELQSLRQMKEDYMALLEKIDGKWYGQLAMKLYRRINKK